MHPTEPTPDTTQRLSESARGWHAIQLAVLGFIGICGVLHNAADKAPIAIQVIAAALAVLGLILAGAAIFTVGRVAWPTNRQTDPTTAEAKLRTGIRQTIAAVILVATATLAGWWPNTSTDANNVTITSTEGQTWCGHLASAPPGVIKVTTAQGPVEVPAQTVARLYPTPACP